jgi:uncharacterized protein (DUF927 family)
VSKKEFNAAETIFEALLKNQLLQTVRDKIKNLNFFYETCSQYLKKRLQATMMLLVTKWSQPHTRN